MLPLIRVRLVVEWKSNWSFVDIVLNFSFVCFGADFTNSVLGGAELGEVLASVVNEFSDSMSSQLILLALNLCGIEQCYPLSH